MSACAEKNILAKQGTWQAQHISESSLFRVLGHKNLILNPNGEKFKTSRSKSAHIVDLIQERNHQGLEYDTDNQTTPKKLIASKG